MRRSLLRSVASVGTAISVMAVSALPPAAMAQLQTPVLGGPGQSVRMPLGDGSRVQEISLPRGGTTPVNFDGRVATVAVGDQTVADVVPVANNSYLLMARQPGHTDVRYYDAAGRVIFTQNVTVQMDISALDTLIGRVAPNARVRSEVIGQNILLSGHVANAAENDQIVRVARSFVAKPENVVNALTISGQDLVRLDVRVVEVNRTVIKQLGFDTKAVFGQLGMDQISIGNSPTYAINGGFQGGGAGGWAINTTSQPVATSPVATLFQGLSTSSGLLQQAAAAGITPSSLAQYVTTYLTGSGPLTAAQTAFAQKYTNGLLGSIQADYGEYQADGTLRNYTATANNTNISTANLPAITQAYLSGNHSLTNAQEAFMNAYFKAIPNYSNAVSQPDSTFIDRTNPANAVATGRAGNTGLNQGNAMLQAFERQGLVRTIAEPNLTTVSGEAAKFLAGGEYPVPTGRDNSGNVTIEFKPYGVGLGFTPVVLSGGRISLKINVEVSELTSQGALTLAGVAGAGTTTVIPALQVRRAENVVELSSGGAAQIAGLLQESTRQNIDKVPGVADLPVLGALARSRDFLNNETELVIIVNAFLVSQVRPDQLQTPADGLRIASDFETTALGRLNHAYKAPAEPTVTAAQPPRAYEGPIGHVIE